VTYKDVKQAHQEFVFNVLFIHTGGVPADFAYSKEFISHNPPPEE
jgi:1-aminocyclopropane-1-carboxylate deaminase/D-cysteine desulfhydrase-like pyridoxal-dependent ACC family enzyme